MGGIEVNANQALATQDKPNTAFPSVLQSAEQKRRTTMFPTAEEVERFWKSKAGYCHGCDVEIALEDQYCPSCREFLLQVNHDESLTPFIE